MCEFVLPDYTSKLGGTDKKQKNPYGHYILTILGCNKFHKETGGYYITVKIL